MSELVITSDETITVTVDTEVLTVTVDETDDLVVEVDDGAFTVEIPDSGPRGANGRQGFGFYIGSPLAANENFYTYVSSGPLDIEAANCRAWSKDVATAVTIITITKTTGGTTTAFGTLTFTPPSKLGVWNIPDGSLVDLDLLDFTAPAVSDLTLSRVSITLAGSI